MARKMKKMFKMRIKMKKNRMKKKQKKKSLQVRKGFSWEVSDPILQVNTESSNEFIISTRAFQHIRFKYFFSLNTNNYILDNANNGPEDELIDSNEHHDNENSSENPHEGASIQGGDYLGSKEDDASYEEDDASYEESSIEDVDGNRGNKKRNSLAYVF